MKPDVSPLAYPEFTAAVVGAIKAFYRGEADQNQQRIAFQWLYRDVFRTDDLSFRLGGPEGARATDFAEGRRFAGTLVRRAVEMTADEIEKLQRAEKSDAR